MTAEERMGLLPKNHVALAKQSRLRPIEAQFANGASLGLIFADSKGDETVSSARLTPEGVLKFSLPGERPAIGLDLGHGIAAARAAAPHGEHPARRSGARHDLARRADLSGVRMAAQRDEARRGGGAMSDAAPRADGAGADRRERGGARTLLPGQSPEGEYILSVLVKRTLSTSSPGGECVARREDQPLILGGDVYWDHPMNSSVRYETRLLAVQGGNGRRAQRHALMRPAASPTTSCRGACRSASVARRSGWSAIGWRSYAGGGDAGHSPIPCRSREGLRYERAYGGTDVFSDLKFAVSLSAQPAGPRVRGGEHGEDASTTCRCRTSRTRARR